MRRTTALGLVAVVFLVGLAGGMLGARLMHFRPDPHGSQLGTPPFTGYFTQENLRLTPDQRRQLESVFDRQRRKFEILHEELRPRVDGLMAETQSEVENILTPQQLERFRARRHRWPGRQRHFGPPGRQPGAKRGLPPPPAAEDPAD